MDQTFADVIRSLSSYFGSRLLNSDGLNKILDIAKWFPFTLSNFIGFESKLCEFDPYVDFFVFIEKDNQAFNSEKSTLEDPSKTIQTHLFLKNISGSIKNWLVDDQNLNKYIDRLFFEFDIPKSSRATDHTPSIFFQINEREFSLEKQKPYRVQQTWIKKFLMHATGIKGISTAIENVAYCFSILSPGSSISHIAVMPGRSPGLIRINITNLNERTLYKTLDAIGLSSLINEVKGFIKIYCNYVDYLVLALDVNDRISPKIGIEFRMPKDRLNLNSQSDWYPFLDVLVDQNLCIKGKRDDLVEWSGRSREICNPFLFNFYSYRYINLIKGVFEPGKRPIFKCYFSFRFIKTSASG